MAHNVSVIIPVYNEERTVGSVVEIARTWPKANEVIVVDDGSTDHSSDILRPFKDTVTLITQKQNKGKGFALVRGIRASTGDIIVFLDSDLVGLTHHDLDALVAPALSGSADMVMGKVSLWASFITPKKRRGLFDKLTGERVVLRDVIEPVLDDIETVGYGVEMFLNDLHKGKRVTTVEMPYVCIVGKFHKHSPQAAFKSYVKESRELMAQFIRTNADDLNPQARKLLRTITSYMKQMFDAV